MFSYSAHNTLSLSICKINGSPFLIAHHVKSVWSLGTKSFSHDGHFIMFCFIPSLFISHRWIAFLICAYNEKLFSYLTCKILLSCQIAFALSDVLPHDFPVYFAHWFITFLNCIFNDKCLVTWHTKSFYHVWNVLHFLMFCHMLSLFISHIVGSPFLIVVTMISVWLHNFTALLCDFLYSHVMIVYTVHAHCHWSCLLYMFDKIKWFL